MKAIDLALKALVILAALDLIVLPLLKLAVNH